MDAYGLFIGACVVPYQSSNLIDTNSYKNYVIDPIFKGFRHDIDPRLNGELDSLLYKPLHYYTFGNFHILSICLVDDFYFANFGYTPNSKYINKAYEGNLINIDEKDVQAENVENTQFEFQVINGFNITSSFEKGSYSELKKYNFIAQCKIKVNSNLLIKCKSYRIIEPISKYILNILNEINDSAVIISESFSWHELTVVVFCNSLNSAMLKINLLRLKTIFDFQKTSNFEFDFSTKDMALFSDTQTSYGVHPEMFNNSSQVFKNYIESGIDSNLTVTSKFHVDTGADKNIIDFFNDKLNTNILESSIKIIDGRSDYTFVYKEPCIENYLKFWHSLIDFRKDVGTDIVSKIRKIHSNILKPTQYFPTTINLKAPNTENHIQKLLKFRGESIRSIEKKLSSLNLSKDLTYSVVSVYNSFNEIISDNTLYQYFIDTHSFLKELEDIINSIADPNTTKLGIIKEKERKYRSVKYLSEVIRTYIGVWKMAYHNRFLESKRFGYNSDFKVEFNGGVHQLIHSYDSVYKLTVDQLNLFGISNKKQNNGQIATFGAGELDIVSSALNLHLNYFQLFYPETFLFSLMKESMNRQFDRFYLNENITHLDELVNIPKKIKSIRKLLATIVYEELDIEWKAMLFEFFNPNEIIESVDYMISYTAFFRMLFKDKMELLIFWFWNNYLQSAGVYNIDGTLNMSMLKINLFAFIYAYDYNQSLAQLTVEDLTKIVRNKNFQYCIQEPICNGLSLFECVKKAIREIEKKPSFTDEIRSILDIMESMFELVELENSESKLYNKLFKITIEYLNWFKREIFLGKEGSESTTYSRIKKGTEKRQFGNYANAVFDSQGGIFVIDANLRSKVLRERITIYKKIREIGINYKMKKY